MSNHGASIEDLSRMTLLGQPAAASMGEASSNNNNNNRDADDANQDGEVKRADSGLYFDDDDDLEKDDKILISSNDARSKQVSSSDLRATSGTTNVLIHRLRERISDWKGVGLTQLKFQMDEQAVKVSELKEGYVHSRKALVSSIRLFTSRYACTPYIHMHTCTHTLLSSHLLCHNPCSLQLS